MLSCEQSRNDTLLKNSTKKDFLHTGAFFLNLDQTISH